MSPDDRQGQPRKRGPKRDGRGAPTSRSSKAAGSSRSSTSRSANASRDDRAGAPRGDRSGTRARSDKPRSDKPRSDKPRSASSSSDRPRSGGSRESGSSAPPPRDRSKDRQRSTAGRWRRDELPEVARTAVQAEYDGPPIPDDITGAELDRTVSAQLKSLPEKLAARVARHLVAAARTLDTDPETAYGHALAARARASRVAMVREAVGETAYASGRFKEALTEFKAARRMSGSSIYLPMMADCERALGRPERAVALAKDPAVALLDDAGQVEMKIVESGARRDLGDVAGAIRVLDGREIRSRSRAPWAARVRYAYADALLDDGQREAALEWFERAAGIDSDGVTDATERVAELEGLVMVDLDPGADVAPDDSGRPAETD